MSNLPQFSTEFSREFLTALSVGGGELEPVAVSPTANVTLDVTTISTNIGMPTTGAPTLALITNIGSNIAFLAFGTSNAVTAANGGLPVLPGTQIMVTIGSFTFVAAITLGGTTVINITTCT